MKKIPTISIPKQQKPVAAKKKAKGKAKTKRGPRLPVMVGAPPLGSTPPDILDTRPKKRIVKLESGAEVAVVEVPKVAPPPPPTPAKEVVLTGRMVQGRTCTWLGDLGYAVDDANGQPRCPHCNGELLNAPDPEITRMGNRLFELGTYDPLPSHTAMPRPHPGYMEFVAWLQKQRCYPTIEDAALVYRKATGKTVDPTA